MEIKIPKTYQEFTQLVRAYNNGTLLKDLTGAELAEAKNAYELILNGWLLKSGAFTLRTLIMSSNSTQAKVAKDVGMDNRRLNKLVVGKYPLTDEDKLVLSYYFNVAPAIFSPETWNKPIGTGPRLKVSTS